MPTREFDGIFYVSEPPKVSFSDGMFKMCFDIGTRASFEVVMSPNTFLRMRRASARVASQFHETASGKVEALGRH